MKSIKPVKPVKPALVRAAVDIEKINTINVKSAPTQWDYIERVKQYILTHGIKNKEIATMLALDIKRYCHCDMDHFRDELVCGLFDKKTISREILCFLLEIFPNDYILNEFYNYIRSFDDDYVYTEEEEEE